MSRFDGHRIYNGCPDSTLQRKWDAEDRLVRKMKALLPTASVTYYPMGEFWMVWDNNGYTPIVDKEFDNKTAAVLAAIAKLKETA